MSSRAYALYQQLPLVIRDRLRVIKHPAETLVAAVTYRADRRRVISGPFKEMAILGTRPFLPYVLGTYEMELHAVVERLVSRAYDQIINVGASNGYYAIGMALRCPSATILAYEADLAKRNALADSASANCVDDRIRILGRCESGDLASALTPSDTTLLIVDIEGEETKLLGLDEIERLRRATILVETHDLFVAGCSRMMRERFSGTHQIECYSTQSRKLQDFPLKGLRRFGFLMRNALVGAMDEGRQESQEWYLMTPKDAAIGA